MQWTLVSPGHWTATDGTRTAEARKMREGALYCNDWMWVTEVDGEYVVNASTLAEAKQAVAAHLS